MPKLSGKMNDRERGVCARVKLAREDIKWPQLDFANAIGIKKDRLASIEYGRTPLHYLVGVDLCEVFGLSADWLVTGGGQMHGGAPILWEVEFPFEKYSKNLFTEVYDLAPEIFRPTQRVFGLSLGPTTGFDAEWYLTQKTMQWFRRMKFRTAADSETFARMVDDFAEKTLLDFLRSGKISQNRLSQIKAEHEAHTKQWEESRKKSGLTMSSLKGNTAAVKSERSEIEKLIDDVKRKTAKPGAKAELARHLDVADARISEWLSGKKEPGGDYALRLRNWVYPPKQK